MSNLPQLPRLFNRYGKPARILVVDDDSGIRRLMALLLEGAGCEATIVASPAAAIARLAADAFDVVLTDAFAPLSDDALCGAAPILHAARPVPVLLFSAHLRPLEQARAAGFRDVVSKPFDVDAIFLQLQAALDD